MIKIVLISLFSFALASYALQPFRSYYWQPSVRPSNNARCVGSFFCGLVRTGYDNKVEQCVSAIRVCNGIKDCSNGADEKHCPPDCITGVLCNDKKTCGTPCDGKRDCPDGMDEDCAASCQCGDGFFKCLNENRCLPASKTCDGYEDCFLGNDEEDCPPSCLCGYGRYLCEDGAKCILPDQFCDGSKDCEHEDDETHCPATCLCSPGQYVCDTFSDENPTCILKDKVCDVEEDCPKNDDETDALCGDIDGSGRGMK